MELIKTSNWQKDIDYIDTVLYGNPDGRTYQRKCIFHDGETYIAYSDNIDFYAEGKEIVSLEPNGVEKTTSDVPQAPLKIPEPKVAVHIEKPDPIEIPEPKVHIEKPDPIKVEVPKAEVTVELPEIKIPASQINVDTTPIAKEIAELKIEIAKLNRPWWKKILR